MRHKFKCKAQHGNQHCIDDIGHYEKFLSFDARSTLQNLESLYTMLINMHLKSRMSFSGGSSDRKHLYQSPQKGNIIHCQQYNLRYMLHVDDKHNAYFRKLLSPTVDKSALCEYMLTYASTLFQLRNTQSLIHVHCPCVSHALSLTNYSFLYLIPHVFCQSPV